MRTKEVPSFVAAAYDRGEVYSTAPDLESLIHRLLMSPARADLACWFYGRLAALVLRGGFVLRISPAGRAA
jgi:hypothetical protein